MKQATEESLKGILVTLLVEFSAEGKKDSETIMRYVDRFVKNFDYYVDAYNDAKEYEED